MRHAVTYIAAFAILMASWCLNTVLAAPGGDRDESKTWSLSKDGILATHPEIEPNNTCATAQEAACGDEIRPAAVEPALDEDYYFLISTGGYLMTLGTDYVSPISPHTDTVIDLFADDCTTLLAHDDDHGPGLFSLVSDFTAPYSGRYYLRVRGHDITASGPYRAYMNCRPPAAPPSNDTCDGATALPRCQSQTLTGTTALATNDYDPGDGGCTGHAEAGRDVIYRFDLLAADTLTVQYSQNDADGAMYLVTDCGNPSGSCLAGADQAPTGGEESFTYVAPGDGAYYLVLDSYGSDTGGPWMLQYSVACGGVVYGACCYPNGQCYLKHETECGASGGTWQGGGTSCTPSPCAPGACCFPSGGCAILAERPCYGAGGLWQGPETVCGSCPGPSGACCLTDGSCVVLEHSVCTAQGGSYQGDGVSCEPDPCAETGACCYLDGHCSVLTSHACALVGGEWHGVGTSCDPNPCPQSGACCFHAGNCTELHELACTQAGGAWQGPGTSCTPNPCPPPTGACCIGAEPCVLLSRTACTAQGGTYSGDDTSCDPDPCARGACCHANGSCDVLTSSVCTAAGGTWLGIGVSCDPNPCPQPGACCFHGGSCTLVGESLCAAQGGIWQGPGTACDPNPCPQPTGACCLPDGPCAILTSATCAERAGSYQGDDVACDPDPCPAIGACCFSDGRCAALTTLACSHQGGEWHGPETSCTPSPCPEPGACCLPSGFCQVELESACLAHGGVWQGAGTSCTPSPCPEAAGACYLPDCTCRILTQGGCFGYGGTWAGAGTTCLGASTSGPVPPATTNLGGHEAPVFAGNILTAGRGGARILYAPSEADDAGYRAAMAAQVGGTCDYFDARFSTPSAGLLDGYDGVMTWTNYAYFDPIGFGNNLADFVDRGGHVILGAFAAYTSGNHLAGRIMTSVSYCPVIGGFNHFSFSYWDRTDRDCCVHQGVVCYGSTYRDYLTLRSGASVCGRFQDHEIANALNASQSVIYANGAAGYPLFPSGQDAQRAANAVICGSPVRVEPTTWGALKALYR